MEGQNISYETKKKLQLYTAAIFLFEKGKSHPQVVELLADIEPDTELLTSIVDKAMHDKWDKLYLEALNHFSKGLTYGEVLAIVSRAEHDEGIAKWICGSWYEWKSHYMECLIDGPTNRFEGMKGIVICSLGASVMFLIKAGWVAKTLWIVALALCILQWGIGMQQRSLSRQIKHLFTID